ncbi:SusD-like starch-binding protein associating with outer membrane [Mucilaginibacter gracilis]|uniref:SusD-like starch-binding protein associating with outer membrane n=1 Tax=Mucilaginibacter gracilis TaxID=423350 RepID=A0A495IW41_9SPHI|nr:RagB/SusD family nutrient uptake outer membrane protein [Mucilaginibacter gracilis]RKR80561.1 SusD-like starch-binding protein associating with outer membrane [Mucilaginibacter gracilis]
MKKQLKKFTYITLIITTCMSSCKKQDQFLATKPDQALSVPNTLADLRSLEENEAIFNLNEPALGEISSDDFYVLTSYWNNLSTLERNSYIWAKQIYNAGANVSDWSNAYSKVYNANVVLDALPNISYNNSQQDLYNQIKGTALFLRSYAFYDLVQTFAKPYDVITSTSDLGIPLRLSSDLNVKSTRATVKQCYDQILADLKTALPLLPPKITSQTQPSQVSAIALLARIYLATGDYISALKYADACLTQFNTLSDYNTLTTPTTTSINNTFVSEDIYHSTLNNYSILAVRRNVVVDSLLYASYDNNDLRKTKFFAILDGLLQFPRFVGSYDFNGNKYSGLATDEIYLIRAECYARSGNTTAAMSDLNTLLATRWKTGTYVPASAANADDALYRILLERRKELLYRGIRWTDLRRLNKEKRFAISLSRTVDGVSYTLPPNDPRYVLPIPDNEIQLSGIPQNER